MASVVVSLLHSLSFLVRSRASLHLEIIALRHQLAVLDRSRRQRLRLTSADRRLWAWLSQRWYGWCAALHVVRPATMLGLASSWFSPLFDVEEPLDERGPAAPLNAPADQ